MARTSALPLLVMAVLLCIYSSSDSSRGVASAAEVDYYQLNVSSFELATSNSNSSISVPMSQCNSVRIVVHAFPAGLIDSVFILFPDSSLQPLRNRVQLAKEGDPIAGAGGENYSIRIVSGPLYRYLGTKETIDRLVRGVFPQAVINFSFLSSGASVARSTLALRPYVFVNFSTPSIFKPTVSASGVSYAECLSLCVASGPDTHLAYQTTLEEEALVTNEVMTAPEWPLDNAVSLRKPLPVVGQPASTHYCWVTDPDMVKSGAHCELGPYSALDVNGFCTRPFGMTCTYFQITENLSDDDVIFRFNNNLLRDIKEDVRLFVPLCIRRTRLLEVLLTSVPSILQLSSATTEESISASKTWRLRSSSRSGSVPRGTMSPSGSSSGSSSRIVRQTASIVATLSRSATSIDMMAAQRTMSVSSLAEPSVTRSLSMDRHTPSIRLLTAATSSASATASGTTIPSSAVTTTASMSQANGSATTGILTSVDTRGSIMTTTSHVSSTIDPTSSPLPPVANYSNDNTTAAISAITTAIVTPTVWVATANAASLLSPGSVASASLFLAVTLSKQCPDVDAAPGRIENPFGWRIMWDAAQNESSGVIHGVGPPSLAESAALHRGAVAAYTLVFFPLAVLLQGAVWWLVHRVVRDDDEGDSHSSSTKDVGKGREGNGTVGPLLFVDEAAPRKKSQWSAWSCSCRLPSSIVIAAQVACVTGVSSGVVAVQQGGPAVGLSAALLAWALGVAVATVAYVAWMTTGRRFRARHAPLPTGRDASVPAWVQRALTGDRMWTAAVNVATQRVSTFHARHRMLYHAQRRGRTWWMSAELAAAIVAVALGSVRSANTAVCGAVAWLIVAVNVVMLALVVALRPFIAPADMAQAVVVGVLSVVAAALMAASLDEAGDVVANLGAAIAVARFALDIAVLALENRRCARESIAATVRAVLGGHAPRFRGARARVAVAVGAADAPMLAAADDSGDDEPGAWLGDEEDPTAASRENTTHATTMFAIPSSFVMMMDELTEGDGVKPKASIFDPLDRCDPSLPDVLDPRVLKRRTENEGRGSRAMGGVGFDKDGIIDFTAASSHPHPRDVNPLLRHHHVVPRGKAAEEVLLPCDIDALLDDVDPSPPPPPPTYDDDVLAGLIDGDQPVHRLADL